MIAMIDYCLLVLVFASFIFLLCSPSPVLDEGATKGSALFLQGIPLSAFFRFDDRNFQGLLRAFLALSPAPRKIWKHKCDNGKTLFLSNRQQAIHLFHCKQQGRAIHTHGAGLEQLRDCLIAANLVTVGVLKNAFQTPRMAPAGELI